MSELHTAAAQPAAVIFDLDGTLVDTVETRIRAWLAVFAEERIPADRAGVSPRIGLDGRRLAREVAKEAGLVLEPGREEAIDVRCGAIFEELNQHPRPLPGVGRLLDRLATTGVPWAIATSSRREQIATSVEALGLARAPLIIDGTHVEHAKPAPDLLLLAANRLEASPPECWYVGDSTWDMASASAAGMVPIGVTTGAVDAQALLGAGALRVVSTLAELEL